MPPNFSENASICGLIYGPCEHHLDHIATLCALAGLPLIVTEPSVYLLAKEFYPSVTVYYCETLALSSFLASNVATIITTLPKDLFDKIFLDQPVSKIPTSVWCPHGNSDKGKHSFFAEALRSESAALLYGEAMLSFFQQKKALSNSCALFFIGSYRYSYFQSHRGFYTRKLNEHLQKQFGPISKTILYAPTWQDHEGFSSVSLALKPLLEQLPSNYNLIIKLHPNTLLSQDLMIQRLILKYESSQNIIFLENFPPIYALLDAIDIYVGDSSSIGYDMLLFAKPLLFINVKTPIDALPLFEMGKVLYQQDLNKLYTYIESHLTRQDSYTSRQRDLANRTFSKPPSKHELLDFLNALPAKKTICTPLV